MKSEKLLYAIGMIDESMIEEAIPKLAVKRLVKKVNRLKKLVTVAACAAISLFAVFVLPQIIKTPFRNAPGGNNSILSGQQKDERNETDQMNIVINELKDFPSMEMDIGLFWDDYIPLNIDELNEYYGIDIRPGYLPETLEKEPVVDVTYGNLGIFKRKDGTVYYDNNELKYQNKDKTQSVVISAAKGHLPKYDVTNLYEGNLQTSDICGNTVSISHYENEEGEHYYAEFLYNGVGFNIWGSNIEKDDFIKMLASYFEK